jgi:hypothetical protein
MEQLGWRRIGALDPGVPVLVCAVARWGTVRPGDGMPVEECAVRATVPVCPPRVYEEQLLSVGSGGLLSEVSLERRRLMLFAAAQLARGWAELLRAYRQIWGLPVPEVRLFVCGDLGVSGFRAPDGFADARDGRCPVYSGGKCWRDGGSAP